MPSLSVDCLVSCETFISTTNTRSVVSQWQCLNNSLCIQVSNSVVGLCRHYCGVALSFRYFPEVYNHIITAVANLASTLLLFFIKFEFPLLSMVVSVTFCQTHSVVLQ